MCVIYYSADKQFHPSIKQLGAMFKANPDGASFTYLTDGKWLTTKGCMTLKEVLSMYTTLREADEVIGHFRLATHGEVSVANCHPFSVVESRRDSQACKDIEKGGLLYHNGVLRGFGSTKVSDTLHFTTSVLARLKLKDRISMLDNTEGKFVYLTPKGTVELFGDFTPCPSGMVFYSNTYWDNRGYTNDLQGYYECDKVFI